VAPGELADHQGRTHRVDGELPGPGCGGTGWIDRPSRSVVTVAKVSASHPVALLTRMSTGPNCSSAASNSFPGVAGRTGRLLRRLLAAAVPDAADDRCGVLGPVVAVFLRGTGIIRIIDPQERAQDRAPALGQGVGGRCADAVVGSRDDRCVPSRHYASSVRPAPTPVTAVPRVTAGAG